MEEQGAVNFSVGEIFSTLEELESKVSIFKDNQFIDLYRRDSKTIASANVKRFIRPELKFYRMKYSCVFGGKKYKSVSSGKRTTS